MTNYAIISLQGKQYQVSEGSTLEIQKYPGKSGDQVIFDQVLLVSANGEVQIGTPTLPVKVYATILEEKKGEKLQIFKYKSKSRYRKMKGARQTLTYLKIESIGAPIAKKSPSAAVKPAAKKPASKKPAPKKSARKAKK